MMWRIRATRGLTGVSLVTAALATGCYDFVLDVPMDGVGQPAQASFTPEPGAKYSVWARYQMELSDSDAKGFCYELEVEALRKDTVLAKETCFAFPQKTCTDQTRRDLGKCRSDCSLSFDSAAPVTLRATLRQTETRCLLEPKPTCGRDFDRCLQALVDPKQLAYYGIKLEKR